MAQRVQIHMIDDLNGEEAQENVRFGLDGSDYEIDLTTENAVELRSALSQYVEVARKATGGRRGQGGRGTSTSRAKRDEVQKIRQWAQDNGHNPSSRGRVPQSIVDAYNQANK